MEEGEHHFNNVVLDQIQGHIDSECDLGLGRGLKPGGIPKTDEDEVDEADKFTIVRVMKSHPSSRDEEIKETNCPPSPLPKQKSPVTSRTGRRKLSDRFRLLRRSKTLQDDSTTGTASGEYTFPTFAEVPLGTSIRQQKELYEHNIQQLFCMNGASDSEEQRSQMSPNKDSNKLSHADVQIKLRRAKEEVDILRQDLELCQLQLDAKYKAISILQKQAQAANTKNEDKVNRAKQLEQKLEKEVNRLQFELDYQGTKIMESQSTWSERFDKVSHDNTQLRIDLDKRSEEFKRAQAGKMAVTRERDELLALLDIQERLKYEQTRDCMPSEDDDVAYKTFTSSELAILGACHCRGQNPEPCGCAHAAVKYKRESSRLREELELSNQREEELEITVDAYRIAFEEQLSRSRSLIRQMAQFTSGTPNKMARAKTSLKWLIKHLNQDPNNSKQNEEENQDQNMNSQLSSGLNGIDLSCNNDYELFMHLLETINDKSEALAHQRLAARMLANKTQELEQKLTTIQEEVFDK